VTFNGLQTSDCVIVFHEYLLLLDEASPFVLTPPGGDG